MFDNEELTLIQEACELAAQNLCNPVDGTEERLHAMIMKAHELQATPAVTPASLTAAQAEVILDAVRSEVHEGGRWQECQNMTLAQLCYTHGDAQGDTVADAPGFDQAGLPDRLAAIRTVDELCNTSLSATLAAFMGWAEPAETATFIP